MTTFGSHLREVRQRRGMSLRGLARQMNWSAPYLSDIELGKRRPPSEEKIWEVSRILEIFPDQLHELARLERGPVKLPLDAEHKEKAKTALVLEKVWSHLTEDEAKQIRLALIETLLKTDWDLCKICAAFKTAGLHMSKDWLTVKCLETCG